jgi:Senescence regulator
LKQKCSFDLYLVYITEVRRGDRYAIPEYKEKKMEEFEEEDILWPDQEDNEEDDRQRETYPVVPWSQNNASAPIRIPSRDNVVRSWTAGINYNTTGSNTRDDDGDEDEDEDEDDYNGVSQGTPGKDISITAPHIFLQQKNDSKSKMVRSVCEGYGRTLKGRDLRNTRDLIHRLTGFLEKS